MIDIRWRGRIGYREAYAQQQQTREALIASREPGELWLLEHDPVVTLGRRGGTLDEAALKARGVDVVQTERGGLATYHGPGQLVGYLLVPIDVHGWTVKGVVAGIEQGIIAWLATVGIEAHLREGAPGVWVGPNKICAIGLHFSHKVSMHGFALNVTTQASAFDGFVPCGISDGGVTSVLQETGRALPLDEIAQSVGSSVLREISRIHV